MSQHDKATTIIFADNAIPIRSWFNDPSDTALLNLLPVLDALRFVSDVRSVLSRNREAHRVWSVSPGTTTTSADRFGFYSTSL